MVLLLLWCATKNYTGLQGSIVGQLGVINFFAQKITSEVTPPSCPTTFMTPHPLFVDMRYFKIRVFYTSLYFFPRKIENETIQECYLRFKFLTQ